LGVNDKFLSEFQIADFRLQIEFLDIQLSCPSLPTGRQAQDGVFRCDLHKGIWKYPKAEI
jgi:hypothetical protein